MKHKHIYKIRNLYQDFSGVKIKEYYILRCECGKEKFKKIKE